MNGPHLPLQEPEEPRECEDLEEDLVADPRDTLTLTEAADRKLTGLFADTSVPVSHLQTGRCRYPVA